MAVDLSSTSKQIDTILVLDFGSQYTQLIARRVRESNVYSEILPWDIDEEKIKSINPKGIILSGGPLNVYQINKYSFDKRIIQKTLLIILFQVKRSHMYEFAVFMCFHVFGCHGPS